MFYFTGDVLLEFQVNFNGTVIIPDTIAITIYLGDTIVDTGTPVRIGSIYNFVFVVADNDILPNYYNAYRFVVSATYNGENIFANMDFIVHAADYDNMDNTVVLLSDGNSEIIMECKDKTLEECLSQPPVKPKIISVQTYAMSTNICDCVVKK